MIDLYRLYNIYEKSFNNTCKGHKYLKIIFYNYIFLIITNLLIKFMNNILI